MFWLNARTPLLLLACAVTFTAQAVAADTDASSEAPAPPEAQPASAEPSKSSSEASPDSNSDEVPIGAPVAEAPGPATAAEQPRDLKSLKAKPADMKPVTEGSAKFYGLNTASPRHNTTMAGQHVAGLRSDSKSRTSDFFKPGKKSSGSAVTVWDSMHRAAARDNSMSRSISAMRSQFKVHKFNSPFEKSAKTVDSRASTSRTPSSVSRGNASESGGSRNRLYVRE